MFRGITLRHINNSKFCLVAHAGLQRRKTQIKRTTTLASTVLPAVLAAVLIVLTGGAAPAVADLKLCNTTPSRIGVAVGYQDPKGWATEGWWTIPSKSCETLLKGKLPSRFYYVHAIDYDRGGEWKGASLMCTARQSFIIRGVDKCKARGYKQTGFFEVDTGNARNWTIRLSDPINKTTSK